MTDKGAIELKFKVFTCRIWIKTITKYHYFVIGTIGQDKSFILV